ncbi:MAG: penicillin-binding transpeptidase domain-containing protein, partial [Anaerolineales bacterium]
MRRLLWVLLVLTLIISACGGSPPAEPTATPGLPEATVRTVDSPDPEPVVRSFLDAWQQDEYERMYDLLSPLTQDGMSLEEFQSRYQEVATDGAINSLDYQIVSSLVNPNSAQVRYRLTLHSAAVGDIVRETWMDLTKEEEAWRIAWTETSILPELAGGRGLQLNLVTPPRANIYDRDGQALATTGNVVALWIVPSQIGDDEAESAMLSALSRLLDRRPESIQAEYDDIRSTDWRVPLGEVSLEEFQQYQGTLGSVGGVQWGNYQGRFYLEQGLAPHAVGYVGQIQAEQLDSYRQRGYPQDAFIGQIGIEQFYEDALRGRPGGTLYLTDPDVNRIEVLAEREFEPPFAVYTNLDRELQGHVRNAISGFTGAALVVERDTGAVLAMASSPDFDPNLFDWHNPNSTVGLQEIFQQNQPLVNRTATGTYPLGSLFKIITMAAALDSERFEPGMIYDCGETWTELPGVTLYDWTYERDDVGPQGEISLSQALARSCNPYFYHIGLDLFDADMQDKLTEMAAAFGLGETTGIEIDEDAGFLPGPDNMPEQSTDSWAARDAVNLAIGQSYLQATPLQAARFVAAVGNGGTLYRPQLVNRLENAVGDVQEPFEPEAQGTLPISDEQLTEIQEAMVNVVRADRGTARRRFMGLSLNIAGKTGTAQTGNDSTEPHSWFGAYTFEEREDTPDIAVVVVLENIGEGSEWAAPVARRIIESYFFDQPITLYP